MSSNVNKQWLEQKLVRVQQALRKAQEEARTDYLTGLGNTRRWGETVEALRASGRPFAFILFDVANLKAANAALGHDGADAFLKRVGSVIRRRGDDVACRTGGDEFGLVLPETSLADARRVRDRLEMAFGHRKLVQGVSVFLVGEAGSWRPGASLGTAIRAADAGVEKRKRSTKIKRGEILERAAALARVG